MFLHTTLVPETRGWGIDFSVFLLIVVLVACSFYDTRVADNILPFISSRLVERSAHSGSAGIGVANSARDLAK